METIKDTAWKWFSKNYFLPYLALLLVSISGIFFMLTNSILTGFLVFAIPLIFIIGTFRTKVRDHYYLTVIKFKGVERWKSNFLHLLFLPNLKK